MAKKVEEMHELIQSFVGEALRPVMMAVAELPGKEHLEDLRAMLVSAAKGTIDIEMDKRRQNPGQTLGPGGPAVKTRRGILTLPQKKIIT